MTDRTDKDYAIEHAGYMVTTARRLLAAISDEDRARQIVDQRSTPVTEQMLERSVDRRHEAVIALRNHMYEFEKRRDRAIKEPAK